MRGRRVRTVARPHCPRMLVGCSLAVRHGPIVYKGCDYGLAIIPLIVGRECSLGARWLPSSHARPATSCECCEGPAPSRSPSRSPSQRAPLGQSGVPPLAGLFCAGARPSPLPPRPPPPICVRLLVCVSVRGLVWVSVMFCL